MIPKSVRELGFSVFDSCVSLSKVIIERGTQLAEIPDSAFSQCRSLETVVLPDTVTEIGDSAFSGCSLLKTLAIPGGMVDVSTEKFSACASLAFIEIKGNSFICRN